MRARLAITRAVTASLRPSCSIAGHRPRQHLRFLSAAATDKPRANTPLSQAYADLVASGVTTLDPDQIPAIAALDATLTRAAVAASRGSASASGLYLHGSVGVGKSFLMDLAFEHCDAVAVGGRQRWHFHSFMLDVHKQLHDARKGSAKYSSDAGEALATVADRVTAAGRLLCFDEFQVTDIADAMILKGLFERLWDRGVVVITTSNRVPARLYEGGLNRSHFLPFVDSLQQRCEVLELRGSQDYRRAVAAESGLFFSPLSADNAAAIQTVFDGLARASAEPPRALTVASGPRLTRSIAVPWAHPGGEGCWFTFEELCGSATGASDFGALAQRFDVIVVSGIPRLSSRQSNEARRMITLIDAAYEHGVRLICSAAAPIDELFEALALDVVTTDEDDDVSRAPSTSVNARAGSDRGDGSTASSPSAAPVREIHLAVSGEGGSSGRSTTYIDGGKTEWSATGRMEVSMSELSSVNEVAFAFARGASRLHEMQGKGFTRRRKQW